MHGDDGSHAPEAHSVDEEMGLGRTLRCRGDEVDPDVRWLNGWGCCVRGAHVPPSEETQRQQESIAGLSVEGLSALVGAA